MTLTELRQAVYDLTNRPDLVSQTLLAIQKATLKIHHSDFYYKDLRESGIEFLTETYYQELDYKTLFPLWRALKYIRKYDAVGLVAGKFFDVKEPTDILDYQYRIELTDICYAAGSVIQVKSSTSFQYAILGYYTEPNITEASYESWIALDHPFAIITEAAASVFRTIGKTDENQIYLAMAMDELNTLKLSNIQTVGY
jgi:hypothetical protein